MENLVSQTSLLPVYRGKKVFLTGHTGFKGAWLSACLHLLGAQVKGYALAPEYPHGLFDLIQPENILESVIADIRSKDRLKEDILAFEPDFVFHLAAQPLVRRSYEIPAETYEVNVVGTANLLEALRGLNKPCTVVVITTDKVYENREQDILYTEDDPLGGYDPYSSSKACTEILVQSFRNSFFHPGSFSLHQKAIASARAGNVIGGGDWSKDRIIPDIVRALAEGRPVEVRNPGSVRPWQHVLEPVSGYLTLAAHLFRQPGAFSKAYNFGPLPEDHVNVKELVELAIKNWGAGEWKDISDASQPHEAGLLKLSIERAKKELNWEPRLNSAQAIDRTISWYRQPESKRLAYTFSQIKDYFNL